MSPQTLARFFFAWTFVVLLAATVINAWRLHGPLTAAYVVVGFVAGLGLTLCFGDDASAREAA